MTLRKSHFPYDDLYVLFKFFTFSQTLFLHTSTWCLTSKHKTFCQGFFLSGYFLHVVMNGTVIFNEKSQMLFAWMHLLLHRQNFIKLYQLWLLLKNFPLYRNIFFKTIFSTKLTHLTKDTRKPKILGVLLWSKCLNITSLRNSEFWEENCDFWWILWCRAYCLTEIEGNYWRLNSLSEQQKVLGNISIWRRKKGLRSC